MPASVNAPTAAKGLRQEWLLAITAALLTAVVALCVWLYTVLSSGDTFSRRPQPVWLGVPKVVSQMSDGRVMEVKVNLQLKDENTASDLSGHVHAFATMIQEVGTSMTKTDIRGVEGMTNYGLAIRESLNDYLEERDIEGRVKHVAFDELTLVR